MTTVAETIARSLYDAGVRIVFGMPGGEVVAVLEALRQLGIRFKLMHHEESAVFAADAYARATGRPGCALTTLGPGALNAVAGIGHAWLDRAPVVLITAQKPDTLLPDYTHQVVDLQAIFAPITKRSLKVTPQNAAGEVPSTVALTMQGRPGPIHLQVSNEEAELAVKTPAERERSHYRLTKDLQGRAMSRRARNSLRMPAVSSPEPPAPSSWPGWDWNRRPPTVPCDLWRKRPTRR